jgi:hypothetical protein
LWQGAHCDETYLMQVGVVAPALVLRPKRPSLVELQAYGRRWIKWK